MTPLTLTTSQASVVLDASGSTSASGKLQYLFEVVPGGKQPALLQSPTNPKATVDFVNGPGLYLVQLVVTDASGEHFDESGGYVDLPAIASSTLLVMMIVLQHAPLRRIARDGRLTHCQWFGGSES